MKVHVSVCSLLVCATLGFPAEADPIKTRNFENKEANLIHDKDVEYSTNEYAELLRISQELRLIPRGLKVEDDNGNLVEISTKEKAGADESIDETLKNMTDRVLFHLYTRKNPNEYQQLWVNDNEALARSFFNPEKPTHFVTHGWFNSGNSPSCTLIRDAYLQNNDSNVIVVDWSKIAKRPYNWASKHAVMIGKYIAEMIDFLEEHANLDTGKTTLVGHSLGAHVIGLAGYHAKGTINYVVGLDPALPMFALAGPGARISYRDATHVQIIHTNAGFLGYLEAIGHTDFYPNGGSKQPGCSNSACSHSRSYKYFVESMNSLTALRKEIIAINQNFLTVNK